MDDRLDAAPCGFLSFADDGAILETNATLRDVLGYAYGELEGRHVEAVLSVGARIFYQTHLFPLLRLSGLVEEVYVSLRARGGADVPVLLNAVRRPRGGAFASDCILVPIRQRSRYEDELLQAKKAAEAANAARVRFLSMMSHDLRTPLSAINLSAEVLLRGGRGPVAPAQQGDLRRIRDASRYVLDLVTDILNYARLEAGRVAVRLERCPVTAVLDRAEGLVAHLMEEHGLGYARRGCSPDLAVRADAERLQQVLLNLLTNAAKFTEAGGWVAVECAREGERVLIRVRDNGAGIAPERLAHLFDPFVQGEAPPRGQGPQGVGLGLAICRELAQAMGGDVTAESAVGEGSVFTVALPAA